jgi:hypothetical protein
MYAQEGGESRRKIIKIRGILGWKSIRNRQENKKTMRGDERDDI